MAGVPAWLGQYAVTQTWEQHLRNGSVGGVDWDTPVGTTIFAPTAGLLTFFYYSDGSSALRITRDDGSRTEFLHGHPHTSTPRYVGANDDIGETDGRAGADGAGPSTGNGHVHVHDITAGGTRVYPFSTIPGSAPAGGGAIPFTPKEADMSKFYVKRETHPTPIVVPDGGSQILGVNAAGGKVSGANLIGATGNYTFQVVVDVEGLVAGVELGVVLAVYDYGTSKYSRGETHTIVGGGDGTFSTTVPFILGDIDAGTKGKAVLGFVEPRGGSVKLKRWSSYAIQTPAS